MHHTIAIVQKPPAYLDKKKTVLLAAKYVAKAASNGSSLIVFPEAYVSGYPTWI